MAARHHIRDESINKEKKNSNKKHVDKILEEIDLSHLPTGQHQKAVDLITEMSVELSCLKFRRVLFIRSTWKLCIFSGSWLKSSPNFISTRSITIADYSNLVYLL